MFDQFVTDFRIVGLAWTLLRFKRLSGPSRGSSMLRRLSVFAAAVAMLGVSALPAAAVTASPPRPHKFSIPGTVGVTAWGSYLKSGRTVKVTVCAKDTARAVDFAAATGIVFSQSGKLKVVSVTAAGYRRTSCRTMTTTYTAHLYVGSGSGDRKGVHTSKVKRIY